MKDSPTVWGYSETTYIGGGKGDCLCHNEQDEAGILPCLLSAARSEARLSNEKYFTEGVLIDETQAYSCSRFFSHARTAF